MEGNISTILYCEDDKKRIKEEHLNQDEMLQKPHVQYVKCEVGIKQETLDPTEPNLVSYQDNVTTKDGVEVKEESWWYYGISTQKQDAELEKNELEDEAISESPRLPTASVYSDGNCNPFLDIRKDAADRKAACGNNNKSRTSIRQNICSFNSNSTCGNNHFEPEQTMGVVNTQMYKCEICQKCYSQKSNLQRHALVHLGTSPYKCDKCEKFFVQNSDLQRHELLHSGTKPYKCDKCDKGFTQKSHLNSHILLHSGIKPHHCDICEKYFTRKSDLKKHMLLHSATKSYKCDVCAKCFTQKSNLDSHKLLHSGTKPYQCDICERFFTRKSDLKIHVMRHSGTKSYKCDICQKCFLQKSTLQIHQWLHSGLKPYKCEICNKYFTLKSSLVRHSLQHTT